MERSCQSWNRLPWLWDLARDDCAMKRSTAISRLSEVADGLERAMAWTGAVRCRLRPAPDRAIGAESTAAHYLCARIEIPRLCLLTLIDEPGNAGFEMGHRRPFRCQW